MEAYRHQHQSEFEKQMTFQYFLFLPYLNTRCRCPVPMLKCTRVLKFSMCLWLDVAAFNDTSTKKRENNKTKHVVSVVSASIDIRSFQYPTEMLRAWHSQFGVIRNRLEEKDMRNAKPTKGQCCKIKKKNKKQTKQQNSYRSITSIRYWMKLKQKRHTKWEASIHITPIALFGERCAWMHIYEILERFFFPTDRRLFLIKSLQSCASWWTKLINSLFRVHIFFAFRAIFIPGFFLLS